MDIFTILSFLPHVIAAASAIAAITPTPKDDGVVKTIANIVDILALNIGRAKDK